jgi:hypothetical protein
MKCRGSHLLPCLAFAAACEQAPPVDVASAPPSAIAAAEPEPAPTPAAPVVVEREPVQRLERAEAFVGRHVLVAAGSELQLAAAADGPKLHLRSADERDPFAFAFAVVDHREGLLVLELAAPEARCDPGLPELAELGARFYLAPELVAPVLARESETRFDDGTAVRLRSGTAIVLEGAHGIADIGGLRVHASLDPRDIGNAFSPAVAAPPERTTDTLAGDGSLRYGEHVLAAVRPLYLDATGRPLVISRSGSGDAERLELVSGCASVRARVDASTPVVFEPAAFAARVGVLGGSMMAHSTIDAGARASWSDGSPAGTSVAKRHFDGAGKRRRARRCFLLGDAHARFEPIELCFAAKDVTHFDPLASLGLIGGGAFEAGLFSELSTLEPAIGMLGAGSGGFGDAGLGSALVGAGDLDSGGLGKLGGGTAGGSIAPGGGGIAAVAEDRVTVELESLSTSGVRDGTRIRETIVAGGAQLVRCAEATEPVPTGVLEASFTIASDGATRGVKVSGLADIAGCARRSIARWRFGSGGETSVTMSLSLQHPS